MPDDEPEVNEETRGDEPTLPKGDAPVSVSVPPALLEEEARARIAKLNLELKSLTRQMSRQGTALEWIKAASTPVALVAAVWTVFAGYNQISEARKAKVREDYKAAVTQLASEKVTDRLTAVSDVSSFLDRDHESFHPGALGYLESALEVEADEGVRAAILRAFSRLDNKVVNSKTLDASWENVVGRNRAFKSSLRITPKDLAFRSLSENELRPLRATADLISLMIRQGRRTQDLSKIFCADCDFSSLELASVKFDGAILADANFSNASIRNGSFEDANVIGASFVSADLRSTKFTDADDINSVAISMLNGQDANAPDFSCADLSDSTFSKQIMFGVDRDARPRTQSGWFTLLHHANLAGADLSEMKVFVRTDLPRGMQASDDLPNYIPFTGPNTKWNDPIPPKNQQYIIVFSTGSQWGIRNPVRKDFAGLGLIVDVLSDASNLSKAKLPPALVEYIKSHPPEPSPFATEHPCTPRFP